MGRNLHTQAILNVTCVFTLVRSHLVAGTVTKPSQIQLPAKHMRKHTGEPNALPLLVKHKTKYENHIYRKTSQCAVFLTHILTRFCFSSPLKPYCCSTCGKSYRQISLLNLHRKRHTDEARYSCEDCGKLFTTSGNLKRHQLVHSGEKPYHCDYCERAFSDPTAKMRHLETHDTDKGHKCQHCDKKFNQVRNPFKLV